MVVLVLQLLLPLHVLLVVIVLFSSSAALVNPVGTSKSGVLIPTYPGPLPGLRALALSR